MTSQLGWPLIPDPEHPAGGREPARNQKNKLRTSRKRQQPRQFQARQTMSFLAKKHALRK
eukprot:294055-Alexandrium_andersonii.AAC.1